MGRKITFYFVVAIFLYLSYATLKMYMADVFLEASVNTLSGGDYTNSLKYASYAVELNPNESNYYRNRARVYLLSTITKKTEDDVASNKLFALSDMQKALSLNKYNLATIRNLVPLYSYLSSKDITVPAGPDNVDDRFLSYTKDFYKYTYDYSQNDVGIYSLLAKHQKRLGLTDDYVLSIERVKNLRPDLLDWYLSE